MIVETLVATLLPVGAEAIKQGFAKWFGGVRAATVDEQIKLDNNEVEKLKALDQLDTPGGPPSQWVVDLRASSRYIAAWACIGIGTYMTSLPEQGSMGAELIGVAFGFLFGSRIVANFKK